MLDRFGKIVASAQGRSQETEGSAKKAMQI
jgi:hypothetical protein